MIDPNVESVRHKLFSRAAAGKKKYGVTTTRQDLSMEDWLVHLQEELMDAAVYVERLLSDVRKTLGHDDRVPPDSDS